MSAHICDYPTCSVAGRRHPLACGCRSAFSPPDAPSALDAMLATAHTRGAEAMREAAALIPEKAAIRLISNGKARVNQVDQHTAHVLQAQAAAIRALPIPPAPEGEGK